MAKKTTCPISRETFREKCKAVKVNIEGKEFEVDPKEFSTGSLGWYLNTKVNLHIDGVSVPVQIGLNLTIVGSKELPGGPGEETAAE